MRIKMMLVVSIIGMFIASCTTTSKTTTEKDISFERLKRTDYTITDDKQAEATVTRTFGLFYNNKDSKNKKGIISMKAGKLTIGNFNVNLSGIVLGTALSLGSGYLLSNIDLKTGKYRSHSDMIKPYSNANYIPYGIAYSSGIIIGFGINAIASPTPYQKAADFAQYKLLTDNKFDYVLNPRFELTKKNSFLTKTATVKITAKGMNIITNK